MEPPQTYFRTCRGQISKHQSKHRKDPEVFGRWSRFLWRDEFLKEEGINVCRYLLISFIMLPHSKWELANSIYKLGRSREDGMPNIRVIELEWCGLWVQTLSPQSPWVFRQGFMVIWGILKKKFRWGSAGKSTKVWFLPILNIVINRK